MIFYYSGYKGIESFCDIERYGNMIVATELAENTGTSITNRAEHIANKVAAQMKIDPGNLIWIEHYNSGSYNRNRNMEDSYSIVTFSIIDGLLRKAKWENISIEEFERLKMVQLK